MSVKYILITIGSEIGLYYNLEDLMLEAKLHVFHYISDHLDHLLPLRADQDHYGSPLWECFDMEAYSVSPEKQSTIEIPYQEWLDEFYEDHKEHELSREREATHKEIVEKLTGHLEHVRNGTAPGVQFSDLAREVMPLWEKVREIDEKIGR